MKKLFVISGSSGVGKGTVIKAFLAKHPEFQLSISCTTRKKREGEVDGKNYFFLSTDEFQNCVQNNEFIEWAEFSGNHYGTKKAFVEECLNNGENLILEIDTKGALNVKNIMPKQPKPVDRDLEKIMADLEEKLKLKVKINAGKKGKGSITLHYNTPAELSSLLDILEQR